MAPMPSDPLTLGDLAVPEQRAGRPAKKPKRERVSRDRLLDVAVDLTVTEGWSAVTITRVAEAAGVARQTVYNEIGTRSDLATEMTMRELDRFLTCVNQAFDAHPDDVIAGIRQATQDTLELGEHSALLRAIASATTGAETEFLPLLTTHSAPLFAAVTTVIRDRISAYDHPFNPVELEIVIDAYVRMVLSYLMQPASTPALTAESLAWIAERVFQLA